MRIIPIKEIHTMDDKELIRAVSGTLTKLYPAKTGTSNGKDWSIQRGELKDASGEMKLFFDHHEEISKNWRGKKIIIEAHNGEKGMSGVYAHDDDYNDKNERIIRVTASGQVYLEGEAPSEENTPAEKPAAPKPNGNGNGHSAASPTAKPMTTKEREAVQVRAVLDAKKQAAKLANLFTIAVDAVDAVIVPHFEADAGGDLMPAEQHQAAIGHLFGCLQRDNFAVNMPVKPLGGNAEKPAPAAEPAPEPPPKRIETPLPPIDPDADDIPF